MNEDLACLVVATVAQIEAKVWFAQQAALFATFNEEIERRVHHAKVVLPKALYPIFFYIDQIDKVDHEHQVMIPVLTDLSYSTLGEYQTTQRWACAVRIDNTAR